MKVDTRIPFGKIDRVPRLIKDFVEGKIEGFSHLIFNKKNILPALLRKEESFSHKTRTLLCRALEKQYRGYSLDSSQEENLELLRDAKTFTVVTGHQPNLFTGPVFFIYKILQTIKTADHLKKRYPDYSFVPVFWMATEDHDFEEINHFWTENHRYELGGASGGAVGKILVQEDYFISAFEKEFQDCIYGTELIEWMKEAYKKGNSLSEAIRKLTQRIFSRYGLLCLDGDDVLLKAEMKSVFRDEIFSCTLKKTTGNTREFIKKAYHKVQVQPREINLFYLTDTRDRIVFDGVQFSVLDKEIFFTQEEILEILEKHPEKFSPNVLMRPVFQESVLPNIAYVGGNAEIMYWLELKEYFAYLRLPFPLLIPRNSLLFLEEKTFKKIDKLHLRISDFFGNFADIITDILLENHPLKDEINDKKRLIRRAFEDLKTQAALTDITFRNLVEAEEKRQLKSFCKMQKRLLRAERIKQKELVERVENLFYAVHPKKNWQERSLNFSVFYSNYGTDWLAHVYRIIDVENSELAVVEI
ncbi:MAG: bacillithiol biosynthesis cysteine-adding enzyme BshC [Bergeyella sp.]|nr:bacillithiol biosynthesis cysteine-adding enzyme BshC [Bergeyella sp.]